MDYSAKHPPGTDPDPRIAAALQGVVKDGRVTCSEAIELADRLGIPPAEVGKTMDLLEHRIIECQLGIFGFEPEKKTLRAAASVSDELSARLQCAASEGRISCAACWETAAALGMERIAVAAACELLGFKIKPCQLGAF